MAKTVAESCGQEFKYEWYGDPDKRSYKVSFDKIRKVLGYKTQHGIAEWAKEIWQKLFEGSKNNNGKMVQTP